MLVQICKALSFLRMAHVHQLVDGMSFKMLETHIYIALAAYF